MYYTFAERKFHWVPMIDYAGPRTPRQKLIKLENNVHNNRYRRYKVEFS
jgi:hypothetical protein